MTEISTSSGAGDPQSASKARGSGLDDEAFDRLFKSCASDLHGYAISLLRDRTTAEDITALAFERLYRARGSLDPERGSPRGWLFAIARNAALDELRRRQRRPEADLDACAIASPTHADALAQVERRASVQRALAQLPLRERELVLLKFHGQLSNAELARVLGISQTNAGTRLHRALTRLREAYERADGEEVA